MVGLVEAANVFKIGYGIGNMLFGKKPKDPTPASNLVSQAKGARQAAEKYGFNPLTMLQHGQTGGAMGASGGGAAPLASIDAIVGGLKDLDDVTSGDQARRRQADQLEIDLAKLKLDRARAGVIGIAEPGHRAANGIGTSTAPFGRNTGTVVQSNSRTVPAKLNPNPIAPDRKVDRATLSNTAGIFEIENAITGGAISIPGDSEPWGLDEVATAVTVGAPQVAQNHGRNIVKEAGEWGKMTPDQKAKSSTTKLQKHLNKYPSNAFGMARWGFDLFQPRKK